MQGCLEEDFAALRKLRDESECDELKETWSGEDPREWRFEYEGEQQPCVQVTGGRVTGLALVFSSLTVLPDAIGELKALERFSHLRHARPSPRCRPRSASSAR